MAYNSLTKTFWENTSRIKAAEKVGRLLFHIVRRSLKKQALVQYLILYNTVKPYAMLLHKEKYNLNLIFLT